MHAQRLAPRLVPQPLWGISGNRLLTSAQWRRIRLATLTASDSTCAVCGVRREKRMVCDEVWEYGGGIATLVALRLVCPDCDAVTHIGQTRIRGYFETALQHLAEVNGMTRAEAADIVEEHFAAWRRQSVQPWRTEVAPELLKAFPELRTLQGRMGSPAQGASEPWSSR